MTAPPPYEAIDIRYCRRCHDAYPSSCPDCRADVAAETHVEVSTADAHEARRAQLAGWALRCTG